jgi:hypothetical protein
MHHSFIYIGLGSWLFALGMLGLVVLAVSCMIRGNKLRFPGLVLLFILLAFLALDGGLLTLFSIISDLAERMGNAWPASRGTERWSATMPLALAVVSGAWALSRVARSKVPLRFTVATLVVTVVAVVQGLTRVGWISSSQVIGVFTSLPLHEPWITIRDAAPRASVIAAIILVLWSPPSRSKTGEVGGGGFPILGDRCPKRLPPDTANTGRPRGGTSG